MSKIEDLIEQATSRDFDFHRGHTATLDEERLVKLVAEDCYNMCKQRALETSCWSKPAHKQDAKNIALAYGLPYNEDDFVVFKEVHSTTHVMDLVDWAEVLETGAINDDDGDGYWMKGTLESDVDCFDDKPNWATHVAWYNK